LGKILHIKRSAAINISPSMKGVSRRAVGFKGYPYCHFLLVHESNAKAWIFSTFILNR
jgi:hypothetical protein